MYKDIHCSTTSNRRESREIDKCSIIFSLHNGTVKIHKVVIHVFTLINFKNIVPNE